MGGRQRQPAQLTWPRGVKPRKFEHQQRIQIAFSYQGVECRELMPPGPVTQTAVNLAAGKRHEVQRLIHAGKKIEAIKVFREAFGTGLKSTPMKRPCGNAPARMVVEA